MSGPRMNLAAIYEDKMNSLSPKWGKEKSSAHTALSPHQQHARQQQPRKKPSWLSNSPTNGVNTSSPPKLRAMSATTRLSPTGGSDRRQGSASPSNTISTTSPQHASNGQSKKFSQTMPLTNGRIGTYPIQRDDPLFRAMHSAWMQSWGTFTSRLKNPDAPVKNVDKTHCRSMLEILMCLGEQIPSVVRMKKWATREQGMAGRAAGDLIKEWSAIISDELDETVRLTDYHPLHLMVATIAELHLNEHDAKNEGLRDLVRMNRNVAAQLLSSASANLENAAVLHTEGALNAVLQVTATMDLEVEDMTLQSFMHFLIQGSYVWKVSNNYPARDWARTCFHVCQLILAPVDTRQDISPPSTNARGRALMAILVRISPHRCPDYCSEHTRALFEVPKLLSAVLYWFYERQSMPESFEDVVTEIVRDLIANVKKLPKNFSKPLEKGLHFGKPCYLCGRKDPSSPLVTACACKEAFFCSRACQTESWAEHKQNCKAAWQEEILAAVPVTNR